jgi:c-di-GMP-related signal transduction protein
MYSIKHVLRNAWEKIMNEVFLGKLPILDCNQNLVAYELLFRSGNHTNVNVIDNSSASANVIIDTYGQLGIENVFGNRRGFIKVDSELLMSDAICLLPKKHVVLEILRSVEITDQIIQRCIDLKQKGYQFAISNIDKLGDDKYEQLLPVVNVVRIDVNVVDKNTLVKIIKNLRRWPVLLLAEKVESREMAKECIALNFQMLQGFYFAKPEILTGKRVDPSKLSLLKMLLLVVRDSDISEIENELKFQPSLSYNLLRMVNSAASGTPRTINSIQRAIMVLGRKQLQRWIQLLLYTAGQKDGGAANALMLTAAVRGKLMESIAIVDRPHDKNHQDRAFMVGTLSLLDTLLSMEMSKIVETLSIQKDMGEALLQRRGYLGKQLELVEANEKGEILDVASILDDLGFMTMNELTNMELEASAWANRICDTTDSAK